MARPVACSARNHKQPYESISLTMADIVWLILSGKGEEMK